MKVKWGHFSDLHFQFPKQKFQTKDLRNKLLEKLKENVEEDGNFTYLFLTGDIFHKGENKEPKISETQQYIKEMASAAGCPLENVIMCPGNHDLSRSRARKLNLEGILKEYNETDGINFNGFYPIVINETCKPFANLCKKINGREEVTETHYYLSLDFLNVYVLNTAIFAGQTYPGERNPNCKLEDTNLYICEENLLNLKSKCLNKNSKKLNIILAHHGTECFPEKEREQFLNFIRDLNIDLYLCGHVHKDIVRTLDEANGTQQFSCGGLFIDHYNSPSFIIGEYDTDTSQICLSNYQYLTQVASWRKSNALKPPYNEDGKFTWTPNRFRSTNLSGRSISTPKNVPPSWNGIKKVSIGLDRDKDFIEVRERATHSITILGVGMSKLSKYALTGQYSLEKLSQKMDINLIMYDPEYLEKNHIIADMLEDFFGIRRFAENVRIAYDTLTDFCINHNSLPESKYKINLFTYHTIPTMSAVIIDEDYDTGELLTEFFCYHCGQNRPLFLVQKNPNEKNDLFHCIKEQIKMLKGASRRIPV